MPSSLSPDYICCGAAWPAMSVEAHERWSNYYHRLYPDSQLVILHDGPDSIPWKQSTARVEYFTPHMGRPSHHNHAGFFRSFFSIQRFFLEAKKILWLEWDFYIASQRFLDWVCSIQTGWRTVWCPQFNFPESSFQVICADQFTAFKTFSESWQKHPLDDDIEKHLPFTEVNRDFVGGRYADVNQNAPERVDYVAQTTAATAQMFYERTNQLVS